MKLNGVRFFTSEKGAVYIPLPREAWRSCGTCNCPVCKGAEGFWDTMAVPGPDANMGHTWTLHFPELQDNKSLKDCPEWLVWGWRRKETA